MKVLFDKLAKAELEDASEYYEFEAPGLGSQFIEEVKNSSMTPELVVVFRTPGGIRLWSRSLRSMY